VFGCIFCRDETIVEYCTGSDYSGVYGLCCNRGRDRRDGYREMDRGRREKFSPVRHDGSPPQMKRMRRDW